MKKNSFFVLAFALLFGAKASAQEWEYSIGFLEIGSPWMKEAKTLKDGNIAVTCSTNTHTSSLNSFHPGQPGLLLLSPNGEELVRNTFYKPAFWGYYPHVLSDEEGRTYILAAYSPDHDSTSANYFMNFDNPPDHSFLGLYRLDEQLSIAESHEFQIPVDTSNRPYSETLFGGYNEYCGNIYVFSAFVDDGSVVGGYIKKPTFDYYNPNGNDSIFFFRIGFDGTLIRHVGYELDRHGEPGGGGLNWSMVLHGYNIVKAGNSSYYCFLNGYPINDYGKQTETEKNSFPGYVYRLDGEFNIVSEKHYHQRDGLGENHFLNAAYIGSRHNTVYLSCEYYPNSYGYTGCALYEYGLDSDKTGILPILRYAERKKNSYSLDDIAHIKGVAIASDNSVYFAYALEDGKNGMTIERLSPDFDTISTLYFGSDLVNNVANIIQSIDVTEKDDILVTFQSTPDYSHWWTTVTKFPAEAFVGIEEAHASGLKVAVAYPNPGGNTLNIRTGLENARLEVYDATGRLIHGQEVTESETAIDAESWPSGIYVWKVYSNNKEAETGKWVKE